MTNKEQEKKDPSKNCRIASSFNNKPKCGAVWCSEFDSCPLRNPQVGPPRITTPPKSPLDDQVPGMNQTAFGPKERL